MDKEKMRQEAINQYNNMNNNAQRYSRYDNQNAMINNNPNQTYQKSYKPNSHINPNTQPNLNQAKYVYDKNYDYHKVSKEISEAEQQKRTEMRMLNFISQECRDGNYDMKHR